MNGYPCMTAAELDAWTEAARRVRNGGSSPCFDCPRWFADQARADGCCEREPQVTGRPGYPVSEARRAQMRRSSKRYRDRQRRRERTRAWKALLRADVETIRASRARATGYNTREGSGLESNKVSPDARLSATTREAGVIASIEVVAR